MMSACNHTPRLVGRDHSYTGSVAVHPYTDENRAAHGNINYMEECSACGAQRWVNCNQSHYEYSPYGPTLAQRKEAERADAVRAAKRRDADDLNAAKQRAVRVIDANVMQLTAGDRRVWIGVDGQEKSLLMSDIRAAARQPDNGDGLVPVYRGVMLMIETAARDVLRRSKWR